MQQFALFVKLNKWKEEKNPISKLEQFFFKLNKWKEEKIQLTLGLKMFVKKMLSNTIVIKTIGATIYWVKLCNSK